MRSRPVVVTALGIAQILAWGSSFYFPAVLAEPIVADTGWSLGWVVGGVSIGLLVAGLIAPRVGSIIERRGGRPVLAASSLLYAAGLAGIGLAPTLPVYLAAWVVLGAGMGTGLYDAVFAALGKLYGKEARTPITNLTLFGGFASTVCWPLSAFLAETVGWRGACFVYASLHLAVSLPLQMAVMPGLAALPKGDAGANGPEEFGVHSRVALDEPGAEVVFGHCSSRHRAFLPGQKPRPGVATDRASRDQDTGSAEALVDPVWLSNHGPGLFLAAVGVPGPPHHVSS